MLRFNLPTEEENMEELKNIMNSHCRSFASVTIREVAEGDRMDYAYRVKLRKGSISEKLLQSLKKIQNVQHINLMMQEATVNLSRLLFPKLCFNRGRCKS